MAERHTVDVEAEQLNMVGVAQLAEHRTVDAKVEGSCPFAHP